MFNVEQAAAYLAAMIDGEGWVGEPKGVQNRAIRITNTDTALIAAVRECCDILGLHYTVYPYRRQKEHWSDGETIVISGRETFERVLETVPVRAPAKLDRIKRTIPTFRQPINLIELSRLRSEGMTLKAIAQELGVSYKRVRRAARLAAVLPAQSSSSRGNTSSISVSSTSISSR